MAQAKPQNIFQSWLKLNPGTKSHVNHYREQKGRRTHGLQSIRKLIVDHFVGHETVLKAGGYKKSAQIIKNSLPSSKRTQSGDLAELLATEYLNSETQYQVPIKKLRWKSDRQMPMHGNDIIAVELSGKTIRVLKGECKSRANFTQSVVAEAMVTLDAHGGRPNPSTLAFIAKRLLEEGRDKEAEVFINLQAGGAIKFMKVDHLLFAFCGNDPTSILNSLPPRVSSINRFATAVVIDDHGNFISDAFN